MRTLSLAVRNLLRNRRRSVATLAAIAIGGSAILLFGGYIANIRYSMETGYVRAGGHLQIQHKDLLVYGNGNPTAYAVKDSERIIRAIKSDEQLTKMVRVVTPTLLFSGIAGNYNAGVSRTVVGLGMVAKDNTTMREWNHYGLPMTTTAFALDGARSDAAVVGIGLARVLQLCQALKIADCPRPAIEAAAAPGAERWRRWRPRRRRLRSQSRRLRHGVSSCWRATRRARRTSPPSRSWPPNSRGSRIWTTSSSAPSWNRRRSSCSARRPRG
jgi:putative ABC transport system permease protein